LISGIVFVVDSADKEALPEVKEELHTILNNNKLAGVPLMIMVNKQDLQGNSYHLHYIIYTSQVNIVFRVILTIFTAVFTLYIYKSS